MAEEESSKVELVTRAGENPPGNVAGTTWAELTEDDRPELLRWRGINAVLCSPTNLEA